jgi:hypothetical protein
METGDMNKIAVNQLSMETIDRRDRQQRLVHTRKLLLEMIKAMNIRFTQQKKNTKLTQMISISSSKKDKMQMLTLRNSIRKRKDRSRRTSKG